VALVLGISAFYHDSAAALVEDGVILAAAQEERFTRIKHDPCFPTQAVASCLRSAGIRAEDLDHVDLLVCKVIIDFFFDTWTGLV
jgi:carbamoyltransferase